MIYSKLHEKIMGLRINNIHEKTRQPNINLRAHQVQK